MTKYVGHGKTKSTKPKRNGKSRHRKGTHGPTSEQTRSLPAEQSNRPKAKRPKAKPGRPLPSTKKFQPKKFARKKYGAKRPVTPHARPKQPVRQTQPSAFARVDGVDHRAASVLAELGMTSPFPVQEAVIPAASRGNDMLVQSPTGSGKTLAFGIPMIEQIKVGAAAPVGLVLAPTRELALQVSEDLAPIARTRQLKVVAVYGGVPIVEQAKRVRRAAIVVATPGRLADLMRQRKIDIAGVRIVVLDEADRMLDMGFQPQVDEIVEKIPGRKQTMLFSATLEGAVGKIADAYTTSPKIIRNSNAVGAGNTIEHKLYATTGGTKVDTVLDILSDSTRDLAVVFVRTKRGADRLCARLRDFGVKTTAIHGGMTQGQRQREYRRFQQGDCDTLIATDVFARGMDIDRITHVVNYDVPEDADTYQHRAGRTGRAGRVGTAVTMVMPNQKRLIRTMAKEVGLPEHLMNSIKQPSGKRWRPVQNEAAAAPGTSKGIVASYSEDKGFGFIAPADGRKDVFFHRSTITGSSGKALKRGASVTFETERNSGRERASIVRLRGGRR